ESFDGYYDASVVASASIVGLENGGFIDLSWSGDIHYHKDVIERDGFSCASFRASTVGMNAIAVLQCNVGGGKVLTVDASAPIWKAHPTAADPSPEPLNGILSYCSEGFNYASECHEVPPFEGPSSPFADPRSVVIGLYGFYDLGSDSCEDFSTS